MTPAATEEAPTKAPAGAPPSKGVEGWAHYYEYFNMLDADMQVASDARETLLTSLCLSHLAPAERPVDPANADRWFCLCAQQTTDLAAQRRSCPQTLLDALPSLRPTATAVNTDSHCFTRIAEAIKQRDQPLVQIEDDENGAAVRARALDMPGGCLLYTSPSPRDS